MALSPLKANVTTPARAHSAKARLKDLSLPARFLIAMCRIQGHEKTVSTIDQTLLESLGRLVAPGNVRRETLEAIAEFHAILVSASSEPFDFARGPRPTLTADESRLLSVLSSMASRPVVCLDLPSLKPSAHRAFVNASQRIINSKVFKTSGSLVFTPRQQLTVVPNNARHSSFKPMHTGVEYCHELSTSESVLLYTIRLWVKGAMKNIESTSSVLGLSAHLGLADSGCLINALMHETALWSSRRFDVRCLCASKISNDEARILCFCAALSNNDMVACRNCLDNWLPADSATALIKNGSNAGCTNQLQALGLPSRAWTFDLLDSNWPQGSAADINPVPRTLH